MNVLKVMDLSAEEAQLRRVMKLKYTGDAQYLQELDRLHLMLANKTLEYYCEDGYDTFFERHRLHYSTHDNYNVEVLGHAMSISLETPFGQISSTGSTWDYISNDLKHSPKPPGLDKKDYTVIKKRMQEIQDSERVLYPFHALHRIGNGYFDTQICMYNAHTLVKSNEK